MSEEAETELPRRPRTKRRWLANITPTVTMKIGPWRRDKYGLTRRIEGVAAPVEAIAPMRAAGRAGGLARARARKAEATKESV
jgi:hypothetical protein